MVKLFLAIFRIIFILKNIKISTDTWTFVPKGLICFYSAPRIATAILLICSLSSRYVIASFQSPSVPITDPIERFSEYRVYLIEENTKLRDRRNVRRHDRVTTEKRGKWPSSGLACDSFDPWIKVQRNYVDTSGERASSSTLYPWNILPHLRSSEHAHAWSCLKLQHGCRSGTVTENSHLISPARFQVRVFREGRRSW